MKRMFGVLLVGGLIACTAMTLADNEKQEEPTTDQEAAQKISGQCHCGNIKYQATGPIIKSSYCDCRGCQRASGTLKVPYVTFSRSNVKVIEGELSEFKANGGEKCDCHGVWLFCPKCGTQIFWKANKGEELDVFAGTLDDTSLFQP